MRTVFDAAKNKEEVAELKKEISDLKELSEEKELESEIEEKIKELEKKIKEKEFSVFLSGKYDRENAILSIYSGAGGQDAQDWATMLLRMYERYCAFKGYKANLLHQSFGEAGGPEGRIGTKSAILEIRGKFAYGFLRKENGVHRLVRISPFSAKQLRHTSFALVEVLPELETEKEIKIRPQDLRIDFYRASGPGGQYVNKRESAVRLTHLPTGIVVSCQSERLQGLNRQSAMKILTAKLYQFKEAGEKEKLREIKAAEWRASPGGRGEKISASWGNQIRSYVLHPYKMVKDLRTKIESSDPERVLDGNLDKFIEEEIKLRW